MKEKYNAIQLPAISLATIIAIVSIVVMTVVSELSGGFKGFLTDLTGHHWVSKGVLSIGIFILIWLVSALGLKGDSPKTKFWSFMVTGIAVAGIIAIFIFYTNHYLSAVH